MKKIVVLGLALTVWSVAGAQVKPAPEMKELAPMIGTWTGDVDLILNGKKHMSGPVIVKHEWVLDGLYMQTTLEQKLPVGMVRGVTFTSYDPNEKRFKAWAFTNEGGPPGPRIEFGKAEGPAFVVETGPGAPFAYRQRMTLQKDGSQLFLMEFKMGEQYVKAAEGVLRKKGG
jgi:hypothetical protein